MPRRVRPSPQPTPSPTPVTDAMTRTRAVGPRERLIVSIVMPPEFEPSMIDVISRLSTLAGGDVKAMLDRRIIDESEDVGAASHTAAPAGGTSTVSEGQSTRYRRPTTRAGRAATRRAPTSTPATNAEQSMLDEVASLQAALAAPPTPPTPAPATPNLMPPPTSVTPPTPAMVAAPTDDTPAWVRALGGTTTPTPSAGVSGGNGHTTMPATAARVVYRVVDPTIEVAGVPQIVRSYLLANGAKTALEVENDLRMKQKSVESALWLLRHRGIVRSIGPGGDLTA